MRTRTLATSLFPLLCAFPLHAANWMETKRDCLSRTGLTAGQHWVESCLIDLLTLQPLHPIFESLAPGSGFGVGLGSDWTPHAGRLESALSVKAAASFDGSFVGSASWRVGF